MTPFPAGRVGKNPPSLGGEEPLEKAMAAHSSTLAWKIPWTEEPGGLQSMDHKVRYDLVTKQQQYVKHIVSGIVLQQPCGVDFRAALEIRRMRIREVVTKPQRYHSEAEQRLDPLDHV